jgi:membrane protease YdiL (CAAX protease family)
MLDRSPLGGNRHLEEMMRESILPLFRECSLETLLLISLAAGVGEELLFRGVAQLGIEQASGSTWLAIAVASVLFGLAHPITKTYALLAGLIGIYFGVLLVATGNLVAPIVAHAAYDFFALVYLLRQDATRKGLDRSG